MESFEPVFSKEPNVLSANVVSTTPVAVPSSASFSTLNPVESKAPDDIESGLFLNRFYNIALYAVLSVVLFALLLGIVIIALRCRHKRPNPNKARLSVPNAAEDFNSIVNAAFAAQRNRNSGNTVQLNNPGNMTSLNDTGGLLSGFTMTSLNANTFSGFGRSFIPNEVPQFSLHGIKGDDGAGNFGNYTTNRYKPSPFNGNGFEDRPRDQPGAVNGGFGGTTQSSIRTLSLATYEEGSANLYTQSTQTGFHENSRTMFNTNEGKRGGFADLLKCSVESLYFPLFLEVFDADYRVIHKLSEGAMGQVWYGELLNPEVRRRAHSKVCVAKISKAANSVHSSLQFRQEIAIMHHLCNHPNIAKIIGFTSQPMVMLLEYYPDGSLANYIKTERIGQDLFRDLSMDIFHGLQHMHGLMIAHCDVKPDNILLKGNLRRVIAVLTDFGISRILLGKSLVVAGFQNFQINGASIRYAGPEAITRYHTRGHQEPNVMKAGDLFGAAMCMYEMICGGQPWSFDR